VNGLGAGGSNNREFGGEHTYKTIKPGFVGFVGASPAGYAIIRTQPSGPNRSPLRRPWTPTHWRISRATAILRPPAGMFIRTSRLAAKPWNGHARRKVGTVLGTVA
jgi:hypothetical protein